MVSASQLRCGTAVDFYQANFKKLEQLLPNLRNLPNALKLKAPGYMDLSVDVLERKKMKLVIALSHYYRHSSGDMIPDPDMQMVVYLATETVEALTYQDCFEYRQIYRFDMGVENPTAKKDLNEFLGHWLDNLLEQGYQFVKP